MRAKYSYNFPQAAQGKFQNWYDKKDPLKKNWMKKGVFAGKSARIQTARQRLADIFDVIEGGGKIKPTKFYTDRRLEDLTGIIEGDPESTMFKTTPGKFLDIADRGWQETDPQIRTYK